MGEKYSITADVISQEKIAQGIFRLTLHAPQAARAAVPGQFVSLYCADESRLLPRPISICGMDPEKGTLTLVYRIAGAGTESFSHLKEGDRIDMIGPLGNGFSTEPAEGKKAVIFGGGIGIPPMLALSRQIRGEKIIVLGYRDELFLEDEFSKCCGSRDALYIATEDGSYGTAGNVLDCVREHEIAGEIAFACGPAPMLRAVKSWALEKGMECYLSLEQRMACGVGACLACVCRSAGIDGHSKVKNKRICAEGPVFDAREIEEV